MDIETYTIFSVITPVYNGASYLEDAIKSVIDQTFTFWELLIIDDGSADNSYSIAKKWEAKDKRIRVLRHPAGINKGVSASRNLGIKSAFGEWIAMLDSDDIWDKNKLEKEFKVISANNDIVCIYSKAIIQYLEDSAKNNGTIYGSGINGKIIDPFKILINGFLFSTSGLLFKKDLVKKTGGFNENLNFSEDTLFVHRLLEFGNIYCIDEVLSYFRLHSDSLSVRTKSKNKVAARYTVYSLLLNTVKEKNCKIVSRALVNVGFKRILRNYILFPKNDVTLVLFYLKDLLGNPKVKNTDKFKALIMFFTEYLIVPFKYLYSKL